MFIRTRITGGYYAIPWQQWHFGNASMHKGNIQWRSLFGSFPNSNSSVRKLTEGAVSIPDLVSKLKTYTVPQLNAISKLVKILKLILISPATNAVSERAFSATSRLKNDLRSTMSQSRLNHIAILSQFCHSDSTKNLNPNQVVDSFCQFN